MTSQCADHMITTDGVRHEVTYQLYGITEG